MGLPIIQGVDKKYSPLPEKAYEVFCSGFEYVGIIYKTQSKQTRHKIKIVYIIVKKTEKIQKKKHYLFLQ